ncbi:hypothetical protein VHEMI05802 [[Torrubiella] hemipterigena]|uniref:Uncharacterized protein n=1 Tax=[Torrubiella] hemipterigena TaxID=1531966 RepID=A0A0A1T595_9HYPO|nr:hypothetical protein VHEMI05802 [[Torrubiella] hemipterigena]
MMIINEFMFSSVLKHLKSLVDDNFDDPLSVASTAAVNWTLWLTRNFHITGYLGYLPDWVLKRFPYSFESLREGGQMIIELTVHEHDLADVKNPDCMTQRLIRAHLDCKSYAGAPMSIELVASEAEITMWGGIVDLGNIMPLGSFHTASDDDLQYRLYCELKSVWPDIDAAPSDYMTLRKLPLLHAVLMESQRLTYGVVIGPPRMVGPSGAVVDGYTIPSKTVVACSTYYVHMNEAKFPNPDKFDPQ